MPTRTRSNVVLVLVVALSLVATGLFLALPRRSLDTGLVYREFSRSV